MLSPPPLADYAVLRSIIFPDLEWLGAEQRTLFGLIVSIDWSLGSCVLVAMAYMVNEWRLLILAVTSPLILAVVAWRYSKIIRPANVPPKTLEVTPCLSCSGGFRSLADGL